MSLGTIQGAAVSVAFAAGVFLGSIMQAGEWATVSTSARHYFATYITTTDCHQDSIQHAVLALVSSQLFGKCQTLSYIKSCGHVGL